MARVLIVEDDLVMATSLQNGFEFNGYATLVAHTGAVGLRLASEHNVDLVVLDVMLPAMSGVDVCKRLRATGSPVPVIMLTARGQETDKIDGLKCGADDYVTKPFSFLELLARVEAVLRRVGRNGDETDTYEFGDVFVDFRMLEATKARQPVDLSPLEFRLLKFLVDHRQQLVSREQVLEAVWGSTSGSLTRTVDVHIAKLRKKLETRPDQPRYIVTIYGGGYKFLG